MYEVNLHTLRYTLYQGLSVDPTKQVGLQRLDNPFIILFMRFNNSRSKNMSNDLTTLYAIYIQEGV